MNELANITFEDFKKLLHVIGPDTTMDIFQFFLCEGQLYCDDVLLKLQKNDVGKYDFLYHYTNRPMDEYTLEIINNLIDLCIAGKEYAAVDTVGDNSVRGLSVDELYAYLENTKLIYNLWFNRQLWAKPTYSNGNTADWYPTFLDAYSKLTSINP